MLIITGALAALILLVVVALVLWQARPGKIAEKRADTRTDDEELVRRWILNNAGDKADRVLFLRWGPHMNEAEIQQLREEAVGSLEHPWALLWLPRDTVFIRVKFQPPDGQITETLGPTGPVLTNDVVFPVHWHKVIEPFELRPGGDDWKSQFRKDLSKQFPAIDREK
jgi:hypothetical protein